MSLAERKSAARKMALARRAAAHVTCRAAAAAALQAQLAGLRDRIVAGYLPIRSEADPLPAMKDLARHNQLCVPVIEGRHRPLVFHRWHPGARLREADFGVMIPEDTEPLVPEILIVPLVAFDRNLYRLGYGGGFYDRTLERLRRAGPVEAIGFGYAAQQVEALPLEPTDQPLDAVVTESGRLPLAP